MRERGLYIYAARETQYSSSNKAHLVNISFRPPPQPPYTLDVYNIIYNTLLYSAHLYKQQPQRDGGGVYSVSSIINIVIVQTLYTSLFCLFSSTFLSPYSRRCCGCCCFSYFLFSFCCDIVKVLRRRRSCRHNTRSSGIHRSTRHRLRRQ